MKGFIRILEAIIASIILLTSLTFFFKTEIRPTEWGDVLTKTRAEDLLYAMERNNTLQEAMLANDATKISGVIAGLDALPPAIDWSLRIKGIPPPFIFIGCSCTQQGKTDLESRLDPLSFAYHGRPVEIRIQQGTVQELISREDTNVLLLTDYDPNLKLMERELNSFLERGGTIFIFSDLEQREVEDGYINKTFGLMWGGVGSSSGIFYSLADAASMKIKKYYGAVQTTGDSTFTFQSISLIAVDSRTAIISDTGQRSLVKTNDGIINGRGRAVWFADYDEAETDVNELLKAAVMWASGESFRLEDGIKRITPKRVEVSFISSYKSGTEAADVYEAVLTLWNILEA